MKEYKRFSRLMMFPALVLLFLSSFTPEEGRKTLVYTYPIRQEIAKPVWRTTQEAFAEAKELGADLIIIHMNTYGGLVDMADSIRTKILNSPVPVWVFIDDNAASAGALISIACDSIYMKPGGKIGAATVVNQTGEQVPDKFQSYMRATMRATAEAQGKDTLVMDGDTLIKWKRDPRIAEAMVDPVIFIEGVVDSGKVLTFTAEEALQNGYCEAIVNNIKEVLEKAGIEDYELAEYKPTALDKVIGFLLSPVIQGLLIMIIIGGIYFELQTPGIGFPLAAAITGAVLYFAPLYLEGLAENWELLIFILGIVLLAVEIFAIPGFGVAGVSGIILIVGGLTMAMIDNVVFESGDLTLAINTLLKAFGIVLVSILIAILGSLWIGKQVFSSPMFPHLALNDTQQKEEGYIGVESKYAGYIGREGEAYTVLRPSGMVKVENEIIDAKSEYGFIEKGTRIRIVRYETGQVYVEPIA